MSDRTRQAIQRREDRNRPKPVEKPKDKEPKATVREVRPES